MISINENFQNNIGLDNKLFRCFLLQKRKTPCKKKWNVKFASREDVGEVGISLSENQKFASVDF